MKISQSLDPNFDPFAQTPQEKQFQGINDAADRYAELAVTDLMQRVSAVLTDHVRLQLRTAYIIGAMDQMQGQGEK